MPAPRPLVVRPTALRALADLVGAPAPEADPPVSGVTLDSRSVQAGDLYAALPGAHVHGASFAAQARDSGAVALLTDAAGAQLVTARGDTGPILVVSDPRAVLGAVSARIYGTEASGLRMVGVTGTNGKTTTAYLITSALEALARPTGLIGTVETRIGGERIGSVRTTPEAPDLHAILAVMAERGLDTCVMEVSSHALAQHRVDGVRYDLALFTNLSQDHLDFHRDMEHYFATKADLFSPGRAARGLVCVDDAWGRRLAEESEIPVVTLGVAADADWRVVVDPADPAAFQLVGEPTTMALRSNLPGDFNVTNTAMAAATLLLLGLSPREVQEAVLADPHVPGRMEKVRAGDGPAPLAVVDYAHTPEAIRAALAALRPATRGPLVCVTGAGGDRDRDKRDAMGRAAAEVADVVLITDDNPRSEDPAEIRAALLAGALAVPRVARGECRVLEVGDRREAIRAACRWALDLSVETGFAVTDATVAVVGKGHETGQEIDGVVHPFNDRDELKAALVDLLDGGRS